MPKWPNWDAFLSSKAKTATGRDLLLAYVHWRLCHGGLGCVGGGETFEPPATSANLSEDLPNNWAAADGLRYFDPKSKHNFILRVFHEKDQDNQAFVTLVRAADQESQAFVAKTALSLENEEGVGIQVDQMLGKLIPQTTAICPTCRDHKERNQTSPLQDPWTPGPEPRGPEPWRPPDPRGPRPDFDPPDPFM